MCVFYLSQSASDKLFCIELEYKRTNAANEMNKQCHMGIVLLCSVKSLFKRTMTANQGSHMSDYWYTSKLTSCTKAGIT